MKTYDILKLLCNALFIFGGGDFWYEENERDNAIYNIYSGIVFLILDVFTVLEVLVIILEGFPENYVNEARMFGITHIIMMIKRYNVRLNKHRARQVNRNMVKACELYEDEDLYKTQYKKIRFNISLYLTTVYMTVFLYVVNGLQRTVSQGEPFLTVTTYWPSYEDTSLTASTVRVLNVFILCVMLGVMIAADSLVMSHLIMLAHKYTTLRKYFEELRETFERNALAETEDARVKALRRGCVEGVVMHQDLLKLFDDIQAAFGVSMSIQVCLCSGSAVLLLMQFALSPTISVASVSITCFFCADLLIMLAVILWNAGDMTYEASLMSDAIFQCGWHLSGMQRPARDDVRHLVLMACAQAQQPLIMKAFGVSDLSYATFAAVVRTTYSMFAVLYNRNN